MDSAVGPSPASGLPWLPPGPAFAGHAKLAFCTIKRGGAHRQGRPYVLKDRPRCTDTDQRTPLRHRTDCGPPRPVRRGSESTAGRARPWTTRQTRRGPVGYALIPVPISVVSIAIMTTLRSVSSIFSVANATL